MTETPEETPAEDPGVEQTENNGDTTETLDDGGAGETLAEPETEAEDQVG